MSKKNIVMRLFAALSSVIIMVTLSACSSDNKTAEYNDGTYTGRSSDFEEDESGNGAGYGEVTIKIESNKITDCTFKMYELDGTLKDENYGSGLSRENRLKAQKAVQSADKYSSAIVGKSSADEVDAISGATISCNEFKEAVNNALKKAEKS